MRQEKVRLNSGEYFDFTVITDIQGNANINWEIAAEDLDDSTFSGSNIKYYLTRLDGSNEVEVMAPRTYTEETASNKVTGRPGNMMSLLSGVTNTNGKVSTNYRLRLYVDENYNTQSDNGNLVYKTRINVYGKVGTNNLVSTLLSSYTNPSAVNQYTSGDKTKMYTFQQKAGEQQVGYTAEELIEYRYIGNTPNNYITFNDEMWRIIGVFTVEDKDGKKEQRVKIMRDESIGTYSWDNTTVEHLYGKNRWSDARLMKVLNPGYEDDVDSGGSSYWNRENKTCFLGNGGNTIVDCNFTSIGLTDDAKSKIEEAKWYLGGWDKPEEFSAELFHEKERGTTILNSINYPRKTNWIGSVGLMYPSDYGYTYSLGVDNLCYNKVANCRNGTATSGWMFNGVYQRVLGSNSFYSNRAFSIDGKGGIVERNAYFADEIRPSVYLKSNIQLLSGSGTFSDPFQIS